MCQALSGCLNPGSVAATSGEPTVDGSAGGTKDRGQVAEDNTAPTLEQLQDLLLESPSFTDFLLGLTTISASLLGGDGAPLLCAITVERGSGPATVASSTDEAKHLDEKQYEFDDGPCLTALREQHRVLIPDLESDDRWHQYAQAIAGDGIRTVLAVPIGVQEPYKAALNCYSRHLSAFGPAAIDEIERHAVSISRILRLALRVHSPGAYPDHLRHALQSRAVVDAAVSLTMVQTRGGREQALEVLRRAAQDSNRTVHDIAQDILTGLRNPAEG